MVEIDRYPAVIQYRRAVSGEKDGDHRVHAISFSRKACFSSRFSSTVRFFQNGVLAPLVVNKMGLGPNYAHLDGVLPQKKHAKTIGSCWIPGSYSFKFSIMH